MTQPSFPSKGLGHFTTLRLSPRRSTRRRNLRSPRRLFSDTVPRDTYRTYYDQPFGVSTLGGVVTRPTKFSDKGVTGSGVDIYPNESRSYPFRLRREKLGTVYGNWFPFHEKSGHRVYYGLETGTNLVSERVVVTRRHT